MIACQYENYLIGSYGYTAYTQMNSSKYIGKTLYPTIMRVVEEMSFYKVFMHGNPCSNQAAVFSDIHNCMPFAGYD